MKRSSYGSAVIIFSVLATLATYLGPWFGAPRAFTVSLVGGLLVAAIVSALLMVLRREAGARQDAQDSGLTGN